MQDNSNGRWERVARASQAEIISKKSNDYLDAYLLSESSLFVWQDRILMITCGDTTLTNAVPEILGFLDKTKVALVFYERKNLMYPEQQPSDFESDVACMEQYFPGKSYRLGPANRDHVHVFYSSGTVFDVKQDTTFQILMHDIAPLISEKYFLNNDLTANQVLQQTGIDRIFPQMDIDSHVFSPYGFSANGIHRQKYFAVHVTPQPEGSYVSFETNVINDDYSETLADVVSIFNPERFSVVLTTSMDTQFRKLHPTVVDAAEGYAVTEKSYYEFDCGYMVTFLNYVMNWEDG